MTEKWNRRSTTTSAYVETDLSDFEPEQLLQALIDDDMLTEEEALQIKKRGGVSLTAAQVINPTDADLVDDAWNEILRGRRTEALYLIERALGGRWLGRLS